MEIRLAAPLQRNSIVDGPGLRAVLWTQGCPHHCKGCHNPTTHDYNGGVVVDIEDIKKEIDDLDLEVGITLSGGDPFVQKEACLEIAKYCHEKGLTVWCYTGYTYEELLKLAEQEPIIIDFLKEIDVLVDGRFILSQRSFDVKFRGSKNQRLIRAKDSIKKGQILLLQEEKEEITKKQKGIFI